MKSQTQTPMMQQYYACKEQAKNALLLFRLGDFYECFDDDAVILANALNITLTKRHETSMSGIPVHTLDLHLQTLMKNNFVVAIAEQIELAGENKGLIQRKVVRVVSPATYFETTRLHAKNNFFAALYQLNSLIGLCIIDISTGECFVQEEHHIEQIMDEIYKRCPKELLLSQSMHNMHKEKWHLLKKNLEIKLHVQENFHFDYESNYEFLTKKFNIQSLDTFGLKGKSGAINAAGALMTYLKDDLCQNLDTIEKIETLKSDEVLSLDLNSLVNLEILPKKQIKSPSLLDLVNQCQTPMGSRLMQSWLIHPLLNLKKIQNRQDAINELFHNHDLLNSLGDILMPIKDIERFTNRIKSSVICPRDLYALANSLINLDRLEQLLNGLKSEELKVQNLHTKAVLTLCKKVLDSLNEDTPIKINEGGIFKRGVIKKLDELYELKANAKEYLASLQNKLREEIGIKSLKINYNNAFGYFIQIPRSQADKMPASFEKKQSLVNNERFICQELKDYEHKILTSQERIIAIEKEHYSHLKTEFFTITEALNSAAKYIAKIDTLKALTILAMENNYTKPTLDEGHTITIEQGRHPLVETIEKQKNFISNDTDLNYESQRLHLITGPNMGGKSTYIRQVAIIVVLAQMGSFVPAKKAHIGIVDKIFSRIGANDDLSRGQSTFMVEMSETANILHNVTHKSLVILDEIGRGTSTFDGIAIAKAVSEYLYEKGCKTLFATHYFELASLEKVYPGIKNFQACVKETNDNVVFLHKILKGSANKSYAIHVAKLSGLPKSVLNNARMILQELTNTSVKKAKPSQSQLTFFQKPSEDQNILETIKKVKIDATTPMQALEMLIKFQKSLLD